MSDDNVKKTTIDVTVKSFNKIVSLCDALDEYNDRQEKEFIKKYHKVKIEPKPEPEGFVVE